MIPIIISIVSHYFSPDGKFLGLIPIWKLILMYFVTIIIHIIKTFSFFYGTSFYIYYIQMISDSIKSMENKLSQSIFLLLKQYIEY